MKATITIESGQVKTFNAFSVPVPSRSAFFNALTEEWLLDEFSMNVVGGKRPTTARLRCSAGRWTVSVRGRAYGCSVTLEASS